MDRKIRDLDDVEKALKKNTADEIIAEAKRQRRRTAMHEPAGLRLGRDSGVLVLPLLVIFLVILIRILDPAGRPAGEKLQETGTPVGTEAAGSIADGPPAPGGQGGGIPSESGQEGAAQEETEAAEDPTIVRPYYDDVLEGMYEEYFDARLRADTDTLYRMTGVTNRTEEQTALLQSQLKTQAGYIEKYGNIRLFAVNGTGENEKLVFVVYDVKFRRVDTPAPGIMYSYVRVNADNAFEIVENRTPAQMQFINQYVMEHEEVVSLINQTNSQLLQAISSDPRLAVIYDAFQTGRIYKEDQSVIDSAVSLISVETEAETVPAEEGGDTASGEGQASGSSGGTAGQESGSGRSSSGRSSSAGGSGASESGRTAAAADANGSNGNAGAAGSAAGAEGTAGGQPADGNAAGPAAGSLQAGAIEAGSTAGAALPPGADVIEGNAPGSVSAESPAEAPGGGASNATPGGNGDVVEVGIDPASRNNSGDAGTAVPGGNVDNSGGTPEISDGPLAAGDVLGPA